MQLESVCAIIGLQFHNNTNVITTTGVAHSGVHHKILNVCHGIVGWYSLSNFLCNMHWIFIEDANKNKHNLLKARRFLCSMHILSCGMIQVLQC